MGTVEAWRAKATYTLLYLCENCGHKGAKSIQKGQLARTAQCPCCGCQTYRRIVGGLAKA